MEFPIGYIKVRDTSRKFSNSYKFIYYENVIKKCYNKFINSLSIFLSIHKTEEVLKSQKAIWSSNDGLLLVYATFNDTNVGQMNYPWFTSNKLVLQAGKILKLIDLEILLIFVRFLGVI